MASGVVAKQTAPVEVQKTINLHAFITSEIDPSLSPVISFDAVQADLQMVLAHGAAAPLRNAAPCRGPQPLTHSSSMKIRFYLLLLSPLGLAHCASTSNPPGPEGTGDHKTGYYLGRSDAVKQQYWMVQNLQKQPKASQPKVTDLPILIPEQTNNGVATVPHTETIRIEQ
jgi:hypothetical protein